MIRLIEDNLWQPIETARQNPHALVDLWTVEGGRRPNCRWTVHYDGTKWEQQFAETTSFFPLEETVTHWMLPPRPPITPENRAAAAVRTLEHMGYTHTGGELWKPPRGPRPTFADERGKVDTLSRWAGEEPDPDQCPTCLRVRSDGQCGLPNCPPRWSPPDVAVTTRYEFCSRCGTNRPLGRGCRAELCPIR